VSTEITTECNDARENNYSKCNSSTMTTVAIVVGGLAVLLFFGWLCVLRGSSLEWTKVATTEEVVELSGSVQSSIQFPVVTMDDIK
jgi:hypothetical protein